MNRIVSLRRIVPLQPTDAILDFTYGFGSEAEKKAAIRKQYGLAKETPLEIARKYLDDGADGD